MIIATPLDLPPIEPDSWDIFWKIWDNYSDKLVKKLVNVEDSRSKIGDDSVWTGLDIYNKFDVKVSWDAPFYDISGDLPKMHNAISMLPIPNIYRVRIIHSLKDVLPHTDDNLDAWKIRFLFYCEDTSSQWYFTKPRINETEKTFLNYPPDTKWFAYNDKRCWHGSVYRPEYPKYLMQIFAYGNPISLVNSSIEKYKNYTIEL